MRVLLKSAKVIAVLFSLGWAGFAIYLGSISNTDRIVITDAYMRVSSSASKSGAVFMVISNGTRIDDRLIGAATPAARKAHLHTHIDAGNSVVQMRPVDGGFALPAGRNAKLKRGGDHVMLMGLNRAMSQGDEITLTLTFEQAGDVILTVPVDLGR